MFSDTVTVSSVDDDDVDNFADEGTGLDDIVMGVIECTVCLRVVSVRKGRCARVVMEGAVGTYIRVVSGTMRNYAGWFRGAQASCCRCLGSSTSV